MKVLIAGDFAPYARLAKQIVERKYSEIFPINIRERITSADFSFVNFESPIVEDGYKPIPKCGPNLRCTPEAAEAIRYAGFTGVTLANNHILDYGPEGLHRTIECCNEQNLDIVGVGDNLKEAGKVLYLEKDGKTLAVVNCCEHEFSIATETEAGANPLNPTQQFYSIREARSKADYVLVIVHGGHEHFQLPSPRMQETYRFFIDAGADAAVNHHQHCYSGYEVYKGKPIFYGIGNFCFDSHQPLSDTWYEGYMVMLQFDKERVAFNIYPYTQCRNDLSVFLLDERTTFDRRIQELNIIIGDSGRLNSEIKKYYKECEHFENSCLEPYYGRISEKLYSLGIVPSFIKGKKAKFILNHIACESHRDKLLFALKNKN